MIKLLVNDQPEELKKGNTIAALVEQLELNPNQVAVEVNLELVPREQHAEFELGDNDKVEIVTLVGGG